MTRYTVDSEAVTAAAGAIGATAGRIQGEAAALHAQLDALQGAWTGSAATAFQGVVQRWRAAQADLEQALAAIDQALRTAGAQYMEIELANARLFG
jgi:early secretory antigenic target protein ESAT-6